MKISLPQIWQHRWKVIWILMQGVFLPTVLWLDDLREAGWTPSTLFVFILLEALYLVDALLFVRIFKGD